MDDDKPGINANDATTFEDRLSSFTPAAPTDGLRERIAQRLDAPVLQTGATSCWRIGPVALGIAGLAAAACVVFAMWLAMSGPTDNAPSGDVIVEDEPVAPAPLVIEQPDDPGNPSQVGAPDLPAGSLLAYHRAMRDSPAAALTAFETQPVSTHDNPAPRGKTLRAMDAAMFLHDDERCDG
ncbi:hypothetical protein OT109_03490 [Phycisphaeraceae bacterium D3-23]